MKRTRVVSGLCAFAAISCSSNASQVMSPDQAPASAAASGQGASAHAAAAGAPAAGTAAGSGVSGAPVGGTTSTAGGASGASTVGGASGGSGIGSAGTAGATATVAGVGGSAGSAGMAGTAAPVPPPKDVSQWAVAGSYKFMQVSNSGPDGKFTLFVPDPLGKDGIRHPIISWGNGVGTTVSRYQSVLEHFATHGFFVVASNSGMTGRGTEMIAGMKWAAAETTRTGGPYFGKLDNTAIGSVGHSMGGIGAVLAGHEPEFTTTVVIAGGDSTIDTIKNPIFLVGNERDEIVTPSLLLQPQFEVATAPIVYAVCKGVMHEEVMKPAGGKEGGYLTAWLDWRLWKNPQARAVFVGADCVLCKDSGWTTMAKMLPNTP